MDEKSLEDIHAYTEKIARIKNWTVNKDQAFRGDIEAGLLTNFRRFGFFQCPCRDGSGDKKKDRDIICPCQYATADIDEFGQCYCALFLRPGFVENGGETTSIPERRPE